MNLVIDNKEYLKIRDEFKIYTSIIKSDSTSLSVDLSKIEKIINDKLPNSLGKNAPYNFPELLFDLKYEYSKFREFILYEHLIGKNIVALGGGFSSGKSSFLNSLLGKNILPSNIDPSTSVPAYIVNSNDTSIYGINIFDSKVDMDMKDIKLISHGFGQLENEQGEEIQGEVSLGHILNSIFLQTPLQKYEHIAFLDTPGYSKADTKDYSAKTDEKIARAQLNSSNYILWFVQADAGSITNEDINFLKTLKEDIPKLIVVNKADKCTKDNLKKIVKKIRETLDLKGIKYIDVVTYSRRKTNEFDSDRIKQYIESWNVKAEETTFAKNFKILFLKCKDYYENVIEKDSKKLNDLNKVITLCDDKIVGDIISYMIKDIQNNIKYMRELTEVLKELKDEFFTEIKYISDKVGIEMPEPSEINLSQEYMKNPLGELKKLKTIDNKKEKEKIYNLMLRELIDSKTVYNCSEGGYQYKDTIFNYIKENISNNGLKF